MAYQTLSLGLTLKIPTNGSRKWGSVIKAECFDKISQHKHTGSGDGNQLITASYAANSVDDSKIRLRNNQYLRARNAAGTGDINVLRVNASDQLELAGVVSLPQASVTTNNSSQTLTIASGQSLLQANINVLAPHTYTVAAGGFLEVADTLTVNGTVIVNGKARVF